MPKALFAPRVKMSGVSHQTARDLASEFFVSVTAALVQMIRVGSGQHAIVLWKMKNKPTELAREVSPNQLSFLDVGDGLPQKRLRVEWAFVAGRAGSIYNDKSAPEDSSIYAAWNKVESNCGEDFLHLGAVTGHFRCENYPFRVEGETRVLSLLHLPGDRDCDGDR